LANLLKPEYLPPDEIRAAAAELVKINFGMTPNEATSEVARLLGFRRTTDPLRQAIEDELKLMLQEQLLVSRNGKLYADKTENGQPSASGAVG
jgi:hypothetical protein